MSLLLGAGCTAAEPVPPATVTVTSISTADAASPQTDAASVFDALQSYWRDSYPAAFGSPYTELRGGIHPLDSGVDTAGVLCISSPAQLIGNAFYCPESDAVVYDTGVLIPVLLDHYGVPGLTAGLAHEFGHAVATRIGVANDPSILRELQADCFAGNFLASALPADQLVTALAPLLDFSDQVRAKPDDPTSHGLAIDRAQAVQLGYRDGPTACRDITTNSIVIALGRFDPPTAAAHPLGLFGPAAIERFDAAGGSGSRAGCSMGEWTASVFGQVAEDQLGGRLSDPDEALNLLRARPGATTDEVFGFLDGFAGRC